MVGNNFGAKNRGRREGRKGLKLACAVTVGIVLLAVAVYVAGWRYYSEHFFPNTVLNGMDVSNMDIEEAGALLEEYADGYSIEITSRQGVETLTADMLGIGYGSDTQAQVLDMIENQDSGKWIFRLFDKADTCTEIAFRMDDGALENANLKALDTGLMEDPQDACLVQTDDGFEIAADTAGSTLDVGAAANAIKDAVNNFEPAVDLETYYKAASVTADDESLAGQKELADKYLSAEITVEDRGVTETVGRDVILGFLYLADDGTVQISDDAIKDYVNNTFDPAFDTVKSTREITTPGSGTFTVSGGTYGYLVSTADEMVKLKEEIENGTVETRKPLYKKEESADGNGGVGDTYIDVNLAAQHVWLVKDGVSVFDTDTVTGCVSTGHETPTGTYFIEFKRTNYTMKKYNTFVYYWMPIDTTTGVGLHDATWRSSFGGSIYQTNGSHGCINLPLSAAKTIFNSVSAGIPVIVH